MEQRPQLIRPGMFGQVVPADVRRGTFDGQNEQLLLEDVPVCAVFAGDSITESWALEAYLLGAEGVVINRGISGDSTQYLRRRFAADVLQLSPKLLVLKIGINNTWDLDQWAFPQWLKTPQDIEERIVADIADMIERATAQGIMVALGSLLPTDIPSLASNSIRNRLVRDVNTQLEALATQVEVVYVDYHGQMVQSDGVTLSPGLADDGLHPNALGYRIMIQTLLTTLHKNQVTMLVSSW